MESHLDVLVAVDFEDVALALQGREQTENMLENNGSAGEAALRCSSDGDECSGCLHAASRPLQREGGKFLRSCKALKAGEAQPTGNQQAAAGLTMCTMSRPLYQPASSLQGGSAVRAACRC